MAPSGAFLTAEYSAAPMEAFGVLLVLVMRPRLGAASVTSWHVIGPLAAFRTAPAAQRYVIPAMVVARGSRRATFSESPRTPLGNQMGIKRP